MDEDGGWITAEQIHNVAFSKPPIGKRGYNTDEVDAFLNLVESALRHPAAGALTSEQVRNVAFSKPPIGWRGYNEDEVDSFLDRVAAQLITQQEGGSPPPFSRRSASRQPVGTPSLIRRIIGGVSKFFG